MDRESNQFLVRKNNEYKDNKDEGVKAGFMLIFNS